MIERKFTVACKEYFGFKPGQNLHEFLAEVKELSEADREYFVREFVKVGIKIIL